MATRFLVIFARWSPDWIRRFRQVPDWFCLATPVGSCRWQLEIIIQSRPVDFCVGNSFRLWLLGYWALCLRGLS